MNTFIPAPDLAVLYTDAIQHFDQRGVNDCARFRRGGLDAE